jgi:hypothetical protein
VDRLVFELALDRIGITPAALGSWGGGLVPADNYHQQLALYREGKADALWQFMGIRHRRSGMRMPPGPSSHWRYRKI